MISLALISQKTGTITVRARVIGKSDVPYTIPRTISLSCKHYRKAKCGSCTVTTDKRPITIEATDACRFADVSERSFPKIIGYLASLPCQKFTYKITKTQSLLRIFLVDEAGSDNQTYTCYYLGSQISVNETYTLTGWVIAEPKTQNRTAVFDKAELIKSGIDSFNVSENHDKLKKFQVHSSSPQDLYDHLTKLYDTYAGNVTHIYDRFDLHISIDLAMRTPLSFTFDGEYFHKGWADVAVIGDTAVGKGFVAEGLQKYFGVGEVVSGDNATLTGLIGGLKSVDRNWTVKWGAFPRNDRGLLLLDETSKLSKYTIDHLTRLRSEGIAEIHKIHSYTTPARVRTIFLLNPGNGKTVSQFAYGIDSIKTVFRDPATMRRLDYVLVVSKEETNTEQVNKARYSVPFMYDQELEKRLIEWTWSRKNSEIKFSPKAVDRTYMLALDLAHTYSPDMPLIQPENIRYKLAKIACALAARVYSCKNHGKVLYVDKVHVECAWVFLNMLYKKQSCGYYAMSKIKNSMDSNTIQYGIVNIQPYFNSFHSKRSKLLEVLLSNYHITMGDIADQTEIPRDIALEVVSKLVKHRLLQRDGFSYRKTDRFTEWLRDEVYKTVEARA